MLESHFSACRKGYLLHEQRKRVLEEFQVSCPIQTVWNDDSSQQIISKNSTPDVYVESRLMNSNEHCVWILVIPDVAVSAVEVAISCEAGLISKQDLCRKGRIHNALLQKLLDKLNTSCEVLGPQSLYFLEVVCIEVLFLQDSQHWRLIWTHGTCASWGVIAYVVHFFSGTIYSRGLKFLQVIYESFACDLTLRFFLFVIPINRYDLFYDNINFYYIFVVIIKKDHIYLLKSWTKKFPVLNYSQSFHK